MDAKSQIAFRDNIMAEVRQLIAAKFKSSPEEISDDSKVAIQQLVNMNVALRDEFNRLAAGAKVTASCVEELQKRVGALESVPSASRIPADIANLKASLVKVQDLVANNSSGTKVAELETRLVDLTAKVNEVSVRSARSVPTDPATPSPSATPDPNTASSATTFEASNTNDPNGAGSGGGVEIKTSDVNRRLTSLEGRIKAIPQPVPYDDSGLIKRIGDAEAKIGTLAGRVNILESTPGSAQAQSVVDLTPLQTSLATLEMKVQQLAGMAATFQPFDPTPLASRISKLEDDAQNNGHAGSSANSNLPGTVPTATPGLSGLFGIGGPPPSDIAILKARVDTLEAQFNALVKVGVSKQEFEPVARDLATLKAKVDGLQLIQTPPVTSLVQSLVN